MMVQKHTPVSLLLEHCWAKKESVNSRLWRGPRKCMCLHRDDMGKPQKGGAWGGGRGGLTGGGATCHAAKTVPATSLA